MLSCIFYISLTDLIVLLFNIVNKLYVVNYTNWSPFTTLFKLNLLSLLLENYTSLALTNHVTEIYYVCLTYKKERNIYFQKVKLCLTICPFFQGSLLTK
jgi:hypothetical protein